MYSSLIISFYQQLDVPHSVCKRRGHSLSVFIMSPHCVWIITVGGSDDKKIRAKFPNIVMLTELGKYFLIMLIFLSISVWCER